MALDLRQNVRSFSHECSSTRRLLEEFIYRIEQLTPVFRRAVVWTIDAHKHALFGTGIPQHF